MIHSYASSAGTVGVALGLARVNDATSIDTLAHGGMPVEFEDVDMAELGDVSVEHVLVLAALDFVCGAGAVHDGLPYGSLQLGCAGVYTLGFGHPGCAYLL